MKFREYTMESVLDSIIDYRGKTPKKSINGIPTLSAKSVKNNHIDYSECYFISESEYKKFMVRGFPQKGDVLLTTEAPMGLVARLDRNGVAVAQRLLTIRGKKDVLDNGYLLYLLQSPYGQSLLKAKETGTTVTGIKQSEFRKIVLRIPDLETQKKIAKVLSALDDKIELNNQINKNLEEQAQALYNSWFVEFEPFGGVVPADWSLINLSDIAEFVGGYSYTSSELRQSTTAMATIKNFDRNKGFKLEGYKEIAPSSKLKICQYVDLFDTLVAHTDLTQKAEVIGNAELLMSKCEYENVIFSMDLVKVVPKNKSLSKFIIAAILQDKRFKEHCLGYVNGTTVLHLSKRALPDYRFLFPSKISMLNEFSATVEAMYRSIALNIDANIWLCKVRDTLLPKLMSGEIDVDNVEI